MVNHFDIKSASAEALMAEYAINQNTRIFSQLYDRFANDLYHFLLTLSDVQLASDIAQKTWLKVYEKPQRYQATAGFKAWLFTVARNALIDEFRKQSRLVSLLDDDIGSLDTHHIVERLSPIEEDANDIHAAFDAALSALSFTQREAFCLQQEGFSLEQIAHITAQQKETIKTRLRYARETLKRKLEKYHE